MKDISAGKIKLIYEFNNESPLFARVAASEIEKGNYLDAIKILDEGIRRHGNYPTAFLILSIAKAYEGKEDEAQITAKIGADLIGSPATYEIYLEKIAKIIAEREALNDALRHPFHTEEEKSILTEERDTPLENKLDVIAQQLSKAKIIPRDDVDANPGNIPEFRGKKIVSETLADIYFTQRNYDEAISIYEELMSQKPEKSEFYLQKIGEIRSASSS